MPLFDEREHGFETEFAHAQEIAFKVKARRNRLICLWVARKIGLKGQDAVRYALDAAGDEMRHSDDAIIASLLGDLRARGMNIGEAELRSELLKYDQQAHQEFASLSQKRR